MAALWSGASPKNAGVPQVGILIFLLACETLPTLNISCAQVGIWERQEREGMIEHVVYSIALLEGLVGSSMPPL